MTRKGSACDFKTYYCKILDQTVGNISLICDKRVSQLKIWHFSVTGIETFADALLTGTVS